MKNVKSDEQTLYSAILQLKTVPECVSFFHDLCTPAEIKAMTERFKIAQLLSDRQWSYREIHEKTGVSLATIGRVARFLSQETYQGYRTVLDRLRSNAKSKGIHRDSNIESNIESKIENNTEN